MSSFEFQRPLLDLALHEEFSPALLVDDPSFGFGGASVLHHRRTCCRAAATCSAGAASAANSLAMVRGGGGIYLAGEDIIDKKMFPPLQNSVSQLSRNVCCFFHFLGGN